MALVIPDTVEWSRECPVGKLENCQMVQEEHNLQ